ncbi:hypothetical protein QN239_31180 [Mycolicibacterium sp. Y3]
MTIHWVAGDGDARRATISAFARPRAWLRVGIGSLVAAAAVAGIAVAAGARAAAAGMLLLGTFAGYLALLQLVSMALVYRRNKRICAAGSRWAAGSDEQVLRFDCPDRTLVLDRSAIRSARRSGTVVVLRMNAGDTFAVPGVLLPDAALQRRIGS